MLEPWISTNLNQNPREDDNLDALTGSRKSLIVQAMQFNALATPFLIPNQGTYTTFSHPVAIS